MPREDPPQTSFGEDEIITSDLSESVPYTSQDFRDELSRVERQKSHFILIAVIVVIVFVLIIAGVALQMM